MYMYLKGYITQAIASEPFLKRTMIPYKNQAISYCKYAIANFHTHKKIALKDSELMK